MLVNQKGYTAAPCIYFTCTIFECGVYKWRHIFLFQMFLSLLDVYTLFILTYLCGWDLFGIVLYVCALYIKTRVTNHISLVDSIQA